MQIAQSSQIQATSRTPRQRRGIKKWQHLLPNEQDQIQKKRTKLHFRELISSIHPNSTRGSDNLPGRAPNEGDHRALQSKQTQNKGHACYTILLRETTNTARPNQRILILANLVPSSMNAHVADASKPCAPNSSPEESESPFGP